MEFPDPPAAFRRLAYDADPILCVTLDDLYAHEPQIFRAIVFLLFTHFKQTATTTLLWLWAMALSTQRQRFIFTVANDALWQISKQNPPIRDSLTQKRTWSRILWRSPQEFWIRYVQNMLRRLRTMYRRHLPLQQAFEDTYPCCQCGGLTDNLCTFCPNFVCTTCSSANARLVNYPQRCADWNHFARDMY